MSGIMPTLDGLRDALAQLPGVRTCRIGLEANLSPGDYPMIRIVPSDLRPHGTLGTRYLCEALVYFGQAIQPFDDLPDEAGRVRLEKQYAALLAMDGDIRALVESMNGQCFETVLDEDRIDTYKLMALKVRVVG